MLSVWALWCPLRNHHLLDLHAYQPHGNVLRAVKVVQNLWCHLEVKGEMDRFHLEEHQGRREHDSPPKH